MPARVMGSAASPKTAQSISNPKGEKSPLTSLDAETEALNASIPKAEERAADETSGTAAAAHARTIILMDVFLMGINLNHCPY